MQYQNKNIIRAGFFAATAYLLPVLTYAQGSGQKDLIYFKDLIVGYLTDIIPLIMFLTILYFIYGIAEFIRKSGNGEELEEAKQKIVWGIIALFVMVSFWGIVTLLTSDFFGESPPLGPPKIDITDVNREFPTN